MIETRSIPTLILAAFAASAGCGGAANTEPAEVAAIHVDDTKSDTLQPSAEPAPQSKSVAGHLAPEVIQRRVRQQFGAFRKCYEARLAKDPQLAVRVTLRFVIGHDGEVSNVATRQTHVNGSEPAAGVPSADELAAEVGACAEKGMRAIRFPQPEGGIVTVSYPIVFSPTN